jgi:hypothetical protein
VLYTARRWLGSCKPLLQRAGQQLQMDAGGRPVAGAVAGVPAAGPRGASRSRRRPSRAPAECRLPAAPRCAGYDVTIASPKGGAVPIDPTSQGQEAMTPEAHRFVGDGGCAVCGCNW